jgi:hypothetical protein
MKKRYYVVGKVISSGVLGIFLFIALFYLYSVMNPPSPQPDVVEGWAAGFSMILAAALCMFVSGALAMFLTFDDVSSSRYALTVPLFSGLITVSVPLLIVFLLGLYALELLFIGLIVIALCLIIAELGGLIVYVLLSIRKCFRRKSSEPRK